MSTGAAQPGLSDLRQRIRELNREITPETLAAVQEIYAPLMERPPYAGVKITRDQRYGSAERNRLDVFEPDDAGSASRPMLIFVHGGGFVGGDKTLEGTPFYDTIGVWAVRHGLVGVNITHRLAPDHPWPAAVEDVAAAVRWVREHAGAHHGDRERVFLMGQSAGAVHSASYLAHPQFHASDGVGLAGAMLLSGLYNLLTLDPAPNLKAYFGDDPVRYAERSSIAGLMKSKVPLMIVVAEMEPPMFHRQALELASAVCERDRLFPRFLSVPGHNHLSEIFHVGSGEDFLASQLLEFIRTGR